MVHIRYATSDSSGFGLEVLLVDITSYPGATDAYHTWGKDMKHGLAVCILGYFL
jgi:hypothetical protein